MTKRSFLLDGVVLAALLLVVCGEALAEERRFVWKGPGYRITFPDDFDHFAGNFKGGPSPTGGYQSEILRPGFNLMGLTLLRSPVTGGRFESSLGTRVTDFEGEFSVTLADDSRTYLVEILDGPDAGAVVEVVGISETTLTLSRAVQVVVVGEEEEEGTRYQVRRAPTLKRLFGETATSSLFPLAGTDIIWLPDGNGGFKRYFLSNAVPGGEFRDADAPFASPPRPVALFYPDALFYQNAGSQKTWVTTGLVKSNDTMLRVREGFNLVAVTPPVGSTLGNAGLEKFLKGGTLPIDDVDVVWVPDNFGQYDTYFYHSQREVWLDAAAPFGDPEMNTPMRSGIFIQRKAGNGETFGLLTVPEFYRDL